MMFKRGRLTFLIVVAFCHAKGESYKVNFTLYETGITETNKFEEQSQNTFKDANLHHLETTTSAKNNFTLYEIGITETTISGEKSQNTFKDANLHHLETTTSAKNNFTLYEIGITETTISGEKTQNTFKDANLHHLEITTSAKNNFTLYEIGITETTISGEKSQNTFKDINLHHLETTTSAKNNFTLYEIGITETTISGEKSQNTFKNANLQYLEITTSAVDYVTANKIVTHSDHVAQMDNETSHLSNTNSNTSSFTLDSVVDLLVRDPETGTWSKFNYSLDIHSLYQLKLTNEEIKASWIDKQKNGNYVLVTQGGRRIPMNGRRKEVFDVKIVKTSSFDENVNLTIKDIIVDPELVPVNVTSLEWNPLNQCNLERIRVDPPLHFQINNLKVVTADEIEGLSLFVINPMTCEILCHKTIATNEFGAYRDLISVVNNLMPGRLVVLFSQFEGSFLLHDTARQILSDVGSAFVNHFLYGDVWVWMFVKDGSTLLESLIPSLGWRENFSFTSSFEVNITKSWNNEVVQDCPNWPLTHEWNTRRIFCQQHDVIRSLCDCSAPLQFTQDISDNSTESCKNIPIIISCGPRLISLMRLLESLVTQNLLQKSSIVLVLDRNSIAIRQLAYILNLRVVIHSSNDSIAAIRVSRNLRFGLFNALKIFKKSHEFIILEDDLLVSPDFYSYMCQLCPLFDLDKSVYAVSGFNFLSSHKTSYDPTLTYRIEGHPSYGWMMSRTIIEELLPKWPNRNYVHDWDILLASQPFRNGRQCVIPDVNRVYHNSLENTGVHVSPSWFSERQFLRKELNNLTNVLLQPYQRLQKEAYENEMRNLIKMAATIKVEDPYNITIPDLKENGTCVIFVKMNSEYEYEAFKLIGDGLETWIGLPTFHMYNHTWRLFYEGHPLFVVGVPFSYYTKFMPEGAAVFSVSPNDTRTKRLLSDDVARKKIPKLSHRMFQKDQNLSTEIANKFNTLFAYPDLRDIFPI